MSRVSEEGSSSTVLDKVHVINNESDLTQMKKVSALLALSYPLNLPYWTDILAQRGCLQSHFNNFTKSSFCAQSGR